MEEAGAIYGNLRAESILIKFDHRRTCIEEIKYLNFYQVIEIEDAANMIIPDQIEHLPPEFLTQLRKLDKFRSSNKLDVTGANTSTNNELDVKFLQASASADMFSLGVILLQIATGCPT